MGWGHKSRVSVDILDPLLLHLSSLPVSLSVYRLWLLPPYFSPVCRYRLYYSLPVCLLCLSTDCGYIGLEAGLDAQSSSSCEFSDSPPTPVTGRHQSPL